MRTTYVYSSTYWKNGINLAVEAIVCYSEVLRILGEPTDMDFQLVLVFGESCVGYILMVFESSTYRLYNSCAITLYRCVM